MEVTMTNLINSFLKYNSIGFDFLNDLEHWVDYKPSYPFYNIKKEDEDKYVIEMALAGFSKNEIEVTRNDDILTIEASENVADNDAKEAYKEAYISKGISKRWFRKQFQLSNSIEIKKVKFENGMLYVHLENEASSRKITFDIA